jgi:DNA-binding MarR family transcriptional regulator
MSKNLDNLRGRVIYILSNFPRISVEILSHYFGQQSTASVEKEIQDLVQDGIVSAEEKHPMDGQRALLRLTTFGEEHLRSLQENLEFQSPKETKKDHIKVLRSRETVFMLDVKIMAFLFLLETEQGLLRCRSELAEVAGGDDGAAAGGEDNSGENGGEPANRANEPCETAMLSQGMEVEDEGTGKTVWIRDTHLQRLFVPMTSQEATLQFVRNILSTDEKEEEEEKEEEKEENAGGPKAKGPEQLQGSATVGEEVGGIKKSGDEQQLLPKKQGTDKEEGDVRPLPGTGASTKPLSSSRRKYMEELFTAKIPPELERRRNLAYVRNLLFALCFKKMVRFRSPCHFALHLSSVDGCAGGSISTVPHPSTS